MATKKKEEEEKEDEKQEEEEEEEEENKDYQVHCQQPSLPCAITIDHRF